MTTVQALFIENQEALAAETMYLDICWDADM